MGLQVTMSPEIVRVGRSQLKKLPVLVFRKQECNLCM